MSIIQRIASAVALTPSELRIGKPEVHAMRLYFNNAQRASRENHGRLQNLLMDQGPWLLTPEFEQKSIPWLRDICLCKNGMMRDTHETRRMKTHERRTVFDLNQIKLAGIIDITPDLSCDYETRYHRGHEKQTTYAVFEAIALNRSFLFYYVPWQGNLSGKACGLHIVPEKRDCYATVY